MILYEYEAKRLFREQGISIPQGEVIRTPKEAEEVARKIGKPVMIKGQVLVPWQGKKEDVQFAETPEAAAQVAERLLQKTVDGQGIREVLVEARPAFQKEIYASIRVDGAAGAPRVTASLERLEDTDDATEHRGKVACQHADAFFGLQAYQARKLAKGLGFSGDIAVRLADQIHRLSKVYTRWNALVAEFTPLVTGPDSNFLAAGGFLEVDDSALFRFPELRELSLSRILDPLAREGRTIGVSYVGLDGDIGVICTGAGIGMATVDLLSKQGRPANFLETGGGITEKQMADVTRLILKKPGLRAVFLNMYGGINPIHEGAKGVVKVIKEDKITIPVVAKAIGNFQEETWKILEEGGVTVIKSIPTDEAVGELFKRLKK
jgi:succinyl-CoA synthetase beta subunit